MEDDLEEFLLDMRSLDEIVLNYNVESTENCQSFTPHPLNAVAIIIITVIRESQANIEDICYYHYYLDDSGKRMIGFGSVNEVAGRIDQWLGHF